MLVLWAAIAFIVISAAVLAYAAFRYKQILSVTSFFVKAATVYVLVGEEDARLAALAAGLGANASDRTRMRDFLRTLSDSFSAQKKRSLWARQIERADHLTNEVGGGGDAIEAREALRRRNEVYVRALRNGDGSVFVRRYPQLFGREAEEAIASGDHPDETAEDMVQEAQGGSQSQAAAGR